MSRTRADRIEHWMDAAAALLFALAAAGCCRILSGSTVKAAIVALAGLCACYLLLRRVRPEQRKFQVADFPVGIVLRTAVDELLLTEEYRSPPTYQVPALYHSPAQYETPKTEAARKVDAAPAMVPVAAEELVLDDVLAEMGEDSRVVRLFDRAAMPTPGELQARIARHIDSSEQPGLPDASNALHEALNELRRALR
ncbi:hypothetical protein ACUXST_001128 [Sphingomonas sp. F9_3S_D5_B_2]